MAHPALPVLTAEGSLRRYLAEIRRFPVLEAEEEYMLAKRWSEHGDYEAAHRLVTSHLRLVAKIAYTFRGYGLPMSELISEGNVGLMQAVKRFEPEKGFRLSTYAIWWIRAAIQEYILRSWSLVKVGSGAIQKRLFFNLRKMKNRLQPAHSQASGQLTPEQAMEIADWLDVSERDVMDMDMRMGAGDAYLSAPVGEDGRAELGDTIEEPSDNQEVLLAGRQELERRRSLLKAAMHKLNERERRVIQARRLAEPPVTLEELSQALGISRERVRQIEARAIEKLATSMAAGDIIGVAA